MGYFLIEHRPQTERDFVNMLKTTAVIRFSLEYFDKVTRVEAQLEKRQVIVVGEHFCVTYSFEDLLQ